MESKFLYAVEHGSLDDCMEMIDTNQDVELLSNALSIASNMEVNLAMIENHIVMISNIMYGVVSGDTLKQKANEYRIAKQDDYLQIVKALLDYGAEPSRLHATATQEMKEYIPVNPRRIYCRGTPT